MCTKFWVENQKGRDRLEGVGVDMKIILECKTKVVPVLN
jgi:hypothetical protein